MAAWAWIAGLLGWIMLSCMNRLKFGSSIAFEKAVARRQLLNQRNAEYFAISMATIITAFTIIHWSSFLWRRFGWREMTSISACSRAVRSVTNRKVPGFNSAGHFTIYFSYIMINVILTFANMDWSALQNFARRLGWMAQTNLMLVIFLSLKNTPLSFLTHYTHNTLNILHRFSGYTTVTFATIHMIVMITAMSCEITGFFLSQWTVIAGFIAAASFLLMAFTGTFLRKNHYELFYLSHIFLFTSTMVMLGYHNPTFASKAIIFILFGSGIWILDRLIRASKMLIFSFGNFATLVPLQNGGTRIFLERAPFGAKAGGHVFLWIPSIRRFETHPFTIVRIQDGGAEFVVAKQDGFTRDLYDLAVKNPGGSIRASVDGPYGITPSFESNDRAVFIAGGSGASFSAGVAVELARRNLRDVKIEFVWVLRDEAQISWYSTELQELKAAPNVTVKLHCTNSSMSATDISSPSEKRTSPSISSISSQPSTSQEYTPLSYYRQQNEVHSAPSQQYSESDSDDIEKFPATTTTITQKPKLSSLLRGLELHGGRPDLGHVIRRNAREAGSDGRVVVCACGPVGMMRIVQGSVAAVVGGDLVGAGVEVFLEAFGW